MDFKKKKDTLLLQLMKAGGWPPPSPVCSWNAPSFTECTQLEFLAGMVKTHPLFDLCSSHKFGNWRAQHFVSIFLPFQTWFERHSIRQKQLCEWTVHSFGIPGLPFKPQLPWQGRRALQRQLPFPPGKLGWVIWRCQPAAGLAFLQPGGHSWLAWPAQPSPGQDSSSQRSLRGSATRTHWGDRRDSRDWPWHSPVENEHSRWVEYSLCVCVWNTLCAQGSNVGALCMCMFAMWALSVYSVCVHCVQSLCLC